jgi:hypothetical protein
MADTPLNCLADTAQQWRFNMKKYRGNDYKESCVKFIWCHIVAGKLLPRFWYKNWSILRYVLRLKMKDLSAIRNQRF